jgi:hypothetical protein
MPVFMCGSIPVWVNIREYAERPARSFSFLLPTANFVLPLESHPAILISPHCASESFRARNTNLFARRLILRFIRRMILAISTDSKLCALIARHATRHRLSADAVAQLGKGQGFAPPRCIPSCVPQTAAETVPVSAPFGLRGVVAFRSWQVHP